MTLFRGRPQIEEVREKIDELLDEGMLLKVDWNELKERINRHYESEWKRNVSNHCYGSDDPLSNDLLDINYAQLHTINSARRKLDKAIKAHPNSPLVRVAQAGLSVVQELDEFSPKMNALKDMIKTSKEIKEAKSPPKPKPKIDPEATRQIQEAMEKISQGVWEQAFESSKRHLTKITELYEHQVAQRPEGKKLSPFKIFRQSPDYARSICRLYDEDIQSREYKRVSNFSELIEKDAARNADFVRDVFINKQVDKLPAIATALGQLKSVKGHLSLRNKVEASLRLEFEQGSSFDVNTQVIFATSVKGNFFSRYQTTFHNIVDKEGNHVGKMLSEDEMHEFAGIEVPKEENSMDGP